MTTGWSGIRTALVLGFVLLFLSVSSFAANTSSVLHPDAVSEVTAVGPGVGKRKGGTASAGSAYPYQDPDQPIDVRVNDLLSRMTLEEKVSQMTFKAPPIPRLAVPGAYWWNQCLSGVASPQATTQFPSCIALSATWSPELVHEVATAISDEARALYVMHADNRRGQHGLFYRAPVVNISRDPRWGRIHEVWGEDPYLTSRMGVAYVKGLQGDDPKYLKLVATLKHFACNNNEEDRHSGSSDVSERMLREYWLPHFRACIVEGGAMSIMAAYNAINGVPCNINRRLLTTILRDEWGFPGFVVSDTGAIRRLVQNHHAFETYEAAAAAAVRAGVDLDSDQFDPVLVESVRHHRISERDIDRSVARILTAKFRLGVFDPPELVPYSKIDPSIIDCRKHRKLSRRANQQSIVLLKNDHSLLPLDQKTIRSLAVIGPHADQCYLGPGYVGVNSKLVSPLDGIRDVMGPNVTVHFSKGCEIVAQEGADQSIAEAARTARTADVAIVVVGTDRRVEAENHDRSRLDLPGRQADLIQAVFQANPKTVVILVNGGPLTISWSAAHVPAILEVFFSGEEFGHALADVIFGKVSPSGKLPYTVYRSVEELPSPREYDITKGYTYLYMKGKPLFPFGHGLSYTRFEYTKLRVSRKTVGVDDEIQVKVDIRNAGTRPGNEVVQLYARDIEARVVRPRKELKGFRRVHLEPGESCSVAFPLPVPSLAFYDVPKQAFVVEPGVFEIQVGSSSEDIRLRSRLRVAD